MSSTIAGFAMSIVSFEKFGNRPMLMDQALMKKTQPLRIVGKDTTKGELNPSPTGPKRKRPKM